MEIICVKCRQIISPSTVEIGESTRERVIDALQGGAMGFDALLEETGLSMAVLAEVLRRLLRDGSLAKVRGSGGVVFTLADRRDGRP